VRILSIVGGGEDCGIWEGVTAKVVRGEGGGEEGSSTSRDSKGLEAEGKEGAGLTGGREGGRGFSRGGLEVFPYG